jgi:hypothetical protein
MYSVLLPTLSSLTLLDVNFSLGELQLPPSLRDLVVHSSDDSATSSFHPTALLGLTASRAPCLQRIECLNEMLQFAFAVPLSITLPCGGEPPVEGEEDEVQEDEDGQGPPAWLPAVDQSVGDGALRLCSSLLLCPEGSDDEEPVRVVPAAASSAALSVLRRSWLPGAHATPPVMELVLNRLSCPHDVLAQLPAGLTHLQLIECRLEFQSLLPVAQSLPRLRVLGLDATVRAAPLAELLVHAQQRAALAVHVWGEIGEAMQLSAEEVASISRLAAAAAAPQPTPQVVWRDLSDGRFRSFAVCTGV